VLETPKGVGDIGVDKLDSRCGLVLAPALEKAIKPLLDSSARFLLVS